MKILSRITFFVLFFVFIIHTNSQNNIYKVSNEDALANGKKFMFWEVNQQYTKTYYVDNSISIASDLNDGSESKPFLTISKAASVLKPGERVIIKEGVYRECVKPFLGGTDSAHMITYEAANGAKVIIKGSFILNKDQFKRGIAWNYFEPYQDTTLVKNIYAYQFDGSEFYGYNPFGMTNLMHFREWLDFKKTLNSKPHFLRRGMIFLDGNPIEQVDDPSELYKKDSGAFWVEHNGMTVHIRFPYKTTFADYSLIEATAKEQVFVPKEYYTNYIKLKGLTFQHAGNGFPVPQNGMVSCKRGHHWIVEDCMFDWANSLGIDMGNESWHTIASKNQGSHVIRRSIFKNCGISGLQAMWAKNMLIEDNLFENIGWQDAELGFESGAIKIHGTSNTLIRRNVIRNIKMAPGIWLDYMASKNCRITKNVFSDINTARGAIYVEASFNHCRIDHNVFNKLTCRYWLSGEYGAGGSALYTDGSDSIDFDHNLCLNIENVGFAAYLNAERIVGGERGGITRWHRVTDNIFINCRNRAIEFANDVNYANGNVYSFVPGGFIKIGNPTPALLLDITSVRTLYGWEKTGILYQRKLTGDLNTKSLEINIQSKDSKMLDLKMIKAGPFTSLEKMINCSIDPRKK